MFKSLRYRLLTWFVLSTILISVLSVTMFQVHRSNKSEHKQAIENLEYLRYQFIKDQNEVNSFISTDINQEGFYQKGESKFLTTHYQLTNSIDSCFVNCYSGKLNTYPGIKESLHSIRDTYTDYCILLDSLVFKMYQRGFSNFGLEGELSSYYYSLENSCNLNKNKLLQLKLSETEYLYRYDTNSIGSLVVLCNNLITSVINSSKYTTSEKTQLVSWIKSYRNTFLEIVAADRKSGLAGNKGFKQDIDRLSSKLENSINHTISIAVQSYNVYNSRLNVIFGLTAFLLLALAFVFSVYTSRYFVYNLEQLTGYISELTRSNFNTSIQLNLRHSTQEVRKIYIEFRKMVAQLTMEKKQRDAALKIAEENQQRYRELANLLPQSIYETDRLGNLVYVNQTWYNTFGYSPEDIDKGLNLIELLNADPKRALFGYYKAENNEFQAKRKDGSKFPATVYSDVIRRGKKVVGRRGIIVDSTMRNKYVESLKREAVRAINSDQYKSSFLANMSHEIRTPMNSIIGFANMLSSKEIPAEQKEEFIYHIQNSSEMLLSLVDDIIDLAKIEANQLKINKTECSPVKLLKNIAANFEAYKNRMEKEHLEIKLMLPNEEMPFRTDSFRLKQILINLMSNAVKFTENGSVEMGLLVSEQRKIRFYVQDTGIGMTNEEIRTVFNRFERTKLSEEKKISGTGLGLAISKSLVELLGGEMWVSSEPGKGSCFSFELPYLRVPAGIAEQIKETKEQSYNWKGKTILIAEDNHVNFDFLKHSLELTGANIIHAENGKQAVQAISFHPEIDIVLMDLKMPKLGGLEATMQIKEIQPYLPVIAQTAFAMEGDRNRCISAGCDDYITKPINIENLKAKIAQFIDRKTAWQTNKSNNLQSTNATENLGKANFTIEHKNKDVDL